MALNQPPRSAARLVAVEVFCEHLSAWPLAGSASLPTPAIHSISLTGSLSEAPGGPQL